MKLLQRIGTTRTAAAAVLLLGGLFTALAWLADGFDVAYGGEGMHIALDAIEATVFLVVGCLGWIRFSRSRLLIDLMVALAFGLVMVTESVFLLALPTLLNHQIPRPLSVWTSSATTVCSSLLLAIGAFAGQRVVGRRATAAVVGLVLVAVGLSVGLMRMYETRLSLPINPGLSPVGAGRHIFAGSNTANAVQAAAALLLLLAGTRLALRPAGERGALRTWMGPALVASALASFNYALFPSLYSYWVYTGDILRLVFCAILTGAVLVDLREAVRKAVEVAVLEERRRLARDLHDGVAQELAFIASEIADLPPELHPSLPWIRSAVERGLYESRRAIAALTLPLDTPLASALAAEVDDVVERSGATVNVTLDDRVEIGPGEREAILRVSREAAINAIRHGRAKTIRITLERMETEIQLQIDDDGSGFDPGEVSTGFGLTIMRERVEATGGTLRVEARPGTGTIVTARWARRTALTATGRSRWLPASNAPDAQTSVSN